MSYHIFYAVCRADGSIAYCNETQQVHMYNDRDTAKRAGELVSREHGAQMTVQAVKVPR